MSRLANCTLTARRTFHGIADTRMNTGADGQNRTGDLPITNRLLYQLSYVGLLD